MKMNAAEYFRNLSPVKDDSNYKKSDHSSKSGHGRCHCCPYGYHIDLDFVRFCQALNQGSKNDNPTLMELKRKKRARRRQTKSMEAMLGLPQDNVHSTSSKSYNIESKYSYKRQAPAVPRRERKRSDPPSPPPRKQSLFHPSLRSPPPPPDIINSSSLILNKRNEEASEALQEAVQDFEDLLESSKNLSRRKSRQDTRQAYPSIDLLNTTSSTQDRFFSSRTYGTKTNGSSLGRSNSLPRQFLQETTFSRFPMNSYKEPVGMTQSLSYSNQTNVGQSPLISEAVAALNAAQGCTDNRAQDFDTMSMSSCMSGVSTTTLQSIRDQMATGLSRLRELEVEVKGYPNMMIKVDILREEKRILLEELQNIQNGLDVSSMIPLFIDKDIDLDIPVEDLETRLETLRKFSSSRDTRRLDRKRSQSPLRVNLQDFHSYRRARRGSLSEGSDCESTYSTKGREREDMSLHISEFNDGHPDGSRVWKAQSSAPPRKMGRDAAVSCRVHTRDVGVSHVPVRTRSVGTSTERFSEETWREPDKKREVRTKPCLHCFKRNQKAIENRSIGTDSPKEDLAELSLSSLSIDSVEQDDSETKDNDISSKNPIVHRMGKKSPIINRLSSPQMHPPVLTFDNSTNTESVYFQDERSNTSLKMDDLFTADQLNELIADAKREWEATHTSKSFQAELKTKKLTLDRGIQTGIRGDSKTLTKNIGVMVRPITKELGTGTLEGLKHSSSNLKNVACGSNVPYVEETKVTPTPVKMKTIAVGDGRLTDDFCQECKARRQIQCRSVGCGLGRVTDVVCDKCSNLKCRSIGVGDARITDELCTKCKTKKCSTACQTHVFSRSVGVEVDFPAPISNSLPAVTPEAEKRPFGSSGVNICDKCHETITTVAKDIVNINSPDNTLAVINQGSKIPRLVEYQKADEKIGSSNKPDVSSCSEPRATKPMAVDLVPKGPDVDKHQDLPRVPARPDRLPLKMEEKPSSKIPKSDALSSGPSLVSSSHPSVSSSPQLKRTYSRQQTYVKRGNDDSTFDNLAFDESAKTEEEKNRTTQPVGGASPSKPARKKALTKTKASESAQKDQGKERRDSFSSSSDEGDGDTSLAASSVAITNLTSSVTSLDDVTGQRKKAQPSRGMRAALKVLNDSIGKPIKSSQQLSNALNIIQKEWFKVSSQKDADPHNVEEYMDVFEEYSRGVLQRVVNLSDVNGNTAMHYAVSHGNFDVVSILLDSKVCSVNQQNKAGYTAIMLVALARMRSQTHEGVVKKLFESGDVNIKASQHGQTALMLAVSHGRLDMVRMLLLTGADPNIQDEDGSTALMCAAEHGHTAIVRFLIGQPDTDLYLMDHDGSTALTIAVEAGHKDVGVLLYKQMNLSRGSSPRSSIRIGKRSKTPTFSRSAATPPRGSAPVSPGPSRKSSGRASPAHPHGSSASLSNLML